MVTVMVVWEFSHPASLMSRHITYEMNTIIATPKTLNCQFIEPKAKVNNYYCYFEEWAVLFTHVEFVSNNTLPELLLYVHADLLQFANGI